jgi:hypothetical protein
VSTYNLRSGHRVTTQRVGDLIEFVTYGTAGNVISSVKHTHAEAVPLINNLRGCPRVR